MPAETPPARHLGRRPALDGLRAVAIALVVGVHVGLIPAGYLGVDVFFVLSGFLITVLLLAEWERTRAISLTRFLERRARRLLPALLVLLAAFTALMLTVHPFAPKWPLGRLDAVTLGFANNWVTTLSPLRGQALGPLSPTWTLAEEGQFYLLWPPVLLLLLRRRLSPRMLLASVVVPIAALLAIGVVIAQLDSQWNAYISPLARGAELLLGALLGILWHRRRLPKVLTRPLVGWLAVGGLAVLLVEGVPARPTWYLAAAGLGAVLIIHLLESEWLVRRVLEARPVAYVGRISYAIYLFHLPILYLLERYAPLPSPAAYWLVVLSLATAAAALSWRLVESPAIRGGRRTRPAGTQTAASPRLRRLRARLTG